VPVPVPVDRLSVAWEVSLLVPPEVSVEKPGGLLSVLSEPVTLLSGELQAIAYDKIAKNNIFLIGIELKVGRTVWSSKILPWAILLKIFLLNPISLKLLSHK
jgi:hypothetical protein